MQAAERLKKQTESEQRKSNPELPQQHAAAAGEAMDIQLQKGQQQCEREYKQEAEIRKIVVRQHSNTDADVAIDCADDLEHRIGDEDKSTRHEIEMLVLKLMVVSQRNLRSNLCQLEFSLHESGEAPILPAPRLRYTRTLAEAYWRKYVPAAYGLVRPQTRLRCQFLDRLTSELFDLRGGHGFRFSPSVLTVSQRPVPCSVQTAQSHLGSTRV